ncbi:MAG: serine/threonine protein kinase/Tfp pilus assembly protein PilF [Planctomycetota bacterium]|jgi:serine/threonine protein kinase/Tfp pilus assembly protein PilF
MTNTSTPTNERIVLAFQERYSNDLESDSVLGLSGYVALWPDHEVLIAREYLSLKEDTATLSGIHGLEDGSEAVGPYVLHEEIGRGGQGLVYKATDTRLGRTVALKVLTGLGPNAERQINRFRREAEIAARLEHNAICGVHEAGIVNGVPFIAMRYVSGQTLAQAITFSRQTSETGEKSGFLDLTDVGLGSDTEQEHKSVDTLVDEPATAMAKRQLDSILLVFEKAARALHAAHEAGVIHRDIKPGNIMVTDEGEPVVLDFGLAHDDSEDMPSLTQTGDFFGTPAYMSPEQIAGQRILLDARSDVYSLGVTLYESLVLRRPFDAPTREGLYQAIMTKEAPDPRRLNRSISKDLKIVLECVLEKDRDKRYQSALAFADDLAAVRELRPIAANPIGPVGRIVRWAKRKPVRATFAAALIIGIPLIAGLSGYIVANLPNIEAQEQALIDEELEVTLERGFYELYRGDKEKAPAYFESALAIRPDSVGAASGLAEAYLKLKEPESALAALEESESAIDDRTTLYALKADVLTKLGRVEEAKNMRELAKPPHSAVTWFLEGLRTWNTGARYSLQKVPDKETRKRAFALIKRAVTASPKARRIYHIMLAVTMRRDASREECVGHAEAMEELWRNDYQICFWSAMCTEFKAPERSAVAFKTAAQVRPMSWTAHANTAIVLHNAGLLKDAIPWFRQAIELNGKEVQLHRSLALCLYDEGRYKEAELCCRQGLGLPTNRLTPFLHTILSRLLRRSGRDKEAAQEIKKAESCCRDLLALARTASEKSDLYDTLAAVLDVENRNVEALHAHEESVRLDPHVVEWHLAIALRHLVMGTTNLAEEFLRSGIKIQNDEPIANMHLGRILHLRGEHKEAKRHLEVALSTAPFLLRIEQANCRFWIREAAWERPNASFLALRHAMISVWMTDRKDPVSLDLLATIEFMQGKFDDAVKHQQELLILMDGKDVDDLKFADAEANLAKYKMAMNGERSK